MQTEELLGVAARYGACRPGVSLDWQRGCAACAAQSMRAVLEARLTRDCDCEDARSESEVSGPGVDVSADGPWESSRAWTTLASISTRNSAAIFERRAAGAPVACVIDMRHLATSGSVSTSAVLQSLGGVTDTRSTVSANVVRFVTDGRDVDTLRAKELRPWLSTREPSDSERAVSGTEVPVPKSHSPSVGSHRVLREWLGASSAETVKGTDCLNR